MTRAPRGRQDWTLPAPQGLTVSIMWSGAIVCTLSDVMSPGLPIPSCGWRTGPQLGPDTDLAIATGNNKQDKPGQNSEYSNKSDLNSGKLVSVEYKRLLHGVGWIVFGSDRSPRSQDVVRPSVRASVRDIPQICTLASKQASKQAGKQASRQASRQLKSNLNKAFNRQSLKKSEPCPLGAC